MWTVATVKNWTGGYSNHLWLDLFEIGIVVATMWVPLIGTFVFYRLLHRIKRDLSDDERSISSNDSFEEEFLFVISDRSLLPVFEG